MTGPHLVLFLLLFVIAPLPSTCFWFPSFSSSSPPSPSHPPLPSTKDMKAEFSIQSFENQEGAKLLEDARRKQLSLNTCWQEAYKNLFSSCSEIIANEEKHKRLAWQLSDCFVKDSGKQSLPSCNMKGPMKECRKKLQDFENDIYLQFFIQTNAICHQLQADAFKRGTERLINDLKVSAQMTEEKLEGLERKSEEILQGSTQVHDSLNSIDLQTQRLAQISSDVEAHIHDALRNSEAIFEQTKGIADSQLELRDGQLQMKEKLESNMELLQKSYESLGDGMELLRMGAVEIEKEITQVGGLMSSKMDTLQSTADDIGNVATTSLEKQKQLLSGQSKALEELEFLTKFQSQALEESRASLQKLSEFSHRQQEELLRRQEQIQQVHDRLIQNSHSILAAQEEFESKQASIFTALDKLFALHNAILVESRFIKSFFFYCAVIFLVYMLTSAKQTFAVRARLYLGLCLSFAIEVAIVRFGDDDFQRQPWITSKVSLLRSSFLLAASLQILHSIFTYRDYEVLNHRMLQELKQKLETIEWKNNQESLDWSVDSDVDLSSWIDEELPEEVSAHEDPDYFIPGEVAQNSIICPVTPRSYNLRPRNRR